MFNRLSNLTLIVFLMMGVGQRLSASDAPLPWELENSHKSYSLLYCPLIKMSLSCGNSRCQPLLGERAETCPQDCVDQVFQNWNLAVQCQQASDFYTPSSVEEVQDIIGQARDSGKKVRVVGGGYSNTDILCSEDVIISSKKLDSIYGLSVWQGQDTVAVGPGVPLFTVMEWLYKRGLALEGYPTPIIRPATVAGAIATSSHSSSLTSVAAMSDILASIEIVNWLGNIQTYSRFDEDQRPWKAATANLGLLGVMTKIRLRVRPAVSLAMKADIIDEESLLAADPVYKPITGCDYGQLWWNPVAKKVLRVCGSESPKEPDLSANNALNEVLFKTLKDLSTGFAAPVSSVFELAACSNHLRCKFRNLVTPGSLVDPNIFTVMQNGRRVFRDQVIGASHRMITSDFDDFNHIRVRFLELAIPQGSQKEALEAIRDYYEQSDTCEIFSVYNLRFVRVTDQSLVANASPGEEFQVGELAMFVEINGYYPKGMPADQFQTFDQYNTGLVRLLIEHYGARPHWGKGEAWYHRYSDQQGRRSEGKRQFRQVLRDVDPLGMFQNDFTERAGFRPE